MYANVLANLCVRVCVCVVEKIFSVCPAPASLQTPVVARRAGDVRCDPT